MQFTSEKVFIGFQGIDGHVHLFNKDQVFKLSVRFIVDKTKFVPRLRLLVILEKLPASGRYQTESDFELSCFGSTAVRMYVPSEMAVIGLPS